MVQNSIPLPHASGLFLKILVIIHLYSNSEPTYLPNKTCITALCIFACCNNSKSSEVPSPPSILELSALNEISKSNFGTKLKSIHNC